MTTINAYDTTFALLRRVGNQAEGAAHWLRQSVGVLMPTPLPHSDPMGDYMRQIETAISLPRKRKNWYRLNWSWAKRMIR